MKLPNFEKLSIYTQILIVVVVLLLLTNHAISRSIQDVEDAIIEVVT